MLIIIKNHFVTSALIYLYTRNVNIFFLHWSLTESRSPALVSPLSSDLQTGRSLLYPGPLCFPKCSGVWLLGELWQKDSYCNKNKKAFQLVICIIYIKIQTNMENTALLIMAGLAIWQTKRFPGGLACLLG